MLDDVSGGRHAAEHCFGKFHGAVVGPVSEGRGRSVGRVVAGVGRVVAGLEVRLELASKVLDARVVLVPHDLF